MSREISHVNHQSDTEEGNETDVFSSEIVDNPALFFLLARTCF